MRMAISRKSSNALELLKFEWKLFMNIPGLKLFWNIPPKWSNWSSLNIEGKSKNPNKPKGWFCCLRALCLPSLASEWCIGGSSLVSTNVWSKMSPIPLDPLKNWLIMLWGNISNPSSSLWWAWSKSCTKSKKGLNWFLLLSLLSPVLGLKKYCW